MADVNKQIDSSNLGAVWERIAQLLKKIVGDVDVSKNGTLQSQITEVSEKVETLEKESGGLEFGISETGCLTVTYDSEMYETEE